MRTMFVHVTSLRAPKEKIVKLRETIAASCLSFAQTQPGYRRGYFIEQVDEPERAQLILVWESQADFEKARSSDAMNCVFQELRDLCSWNIRSDGYLATVNPGNLPRTENNTKGQTMEFKCGAPVYTSDGKNIGSYVNLLPPE